jgi:peptidoglycan-N-acetylglucosamine deacetylase
MTNTIMGNRPLAAGLVAMVALAACQAMAAHQAIAAPSPVPGCANPNAIGWSRAIEIDAAKGQVYGGITQAPSLDLLRPKEVVLTFDDGPYEGLSRRILDTLDQHCTKATFFVVGQMALARPSIVREEIARGHTVGTHTWSHPMPMKALTVPAQIEEIDKGIAAASRVAGKSLAPFFRFPGLGDSPETLEHLKARGIATFTVDIVSNDSFIADPQKLAERTMNILASKGKGILLFHDIKPSTAAALPVILDELQRGGYHVVHFVPKGQGGLKRPPVMAPRQNGPAMTVSAPNTDRGPERLPWGFAHQGPMPTILPGAAPGTPQRVPATAARQPVEPLTPARPATVAPAVPPAPVRPKPPAREWETTVFSTNGS